METWIIFSVLSALLWAIANMIDKYVLTKWIKKPTVPLMFLGTLHVTAALIIFSIKGVAKLSLPNILLAFLYGNVFLLVSYFYFKAVKKAEVSRVVPLLQLAPLFTLLFAWVFLNEVLTLPQYIGIIFLVLGAILISVKRSMDVNSLKPYLLILGTAFVYGVGSVIVKHLLQFVDFWTAFAYVRLSMLPSLIVIIYFTFSHLIHTVKKDGRRVFASVLLAQLLMLGGVFSFVFALSLGSVSLVRALPSVQQFFVLIFAIFLSIFYPKILKEEVGKSTLLLKILATGLIFAGVVLIV